MSAGNSCACLFRLPIEPPAGIAPHWCSPRLCLECARGPCRAGDDHFGQQSALAPGLRHPGSCQRRPARAVGAAMQAVYAGYPPDPRQSGPIGCARCGAHPAEPGPALGAERLNRPGPCWRWTSSILYGDMKERRGCSGSNRSRRTRSSQAWSPGRWCVLSRPSRSASATTTAP